MAILKFSKSRKVITNSVLVGLAFLFSVNSIQATDLASSPLRAWDNILLEGVFHKANPLVRNIKQDQAERIFSFTRSEPDTEELEYSIVIVVGPAGNRQDPDICSSKNGNEENELKCEPSPIGLRWQNQPVHFGPDGVITSVVFTTKDGYFDVLISVYEKSNDSPNPVLTATDAALNVSAAYNATFSE